MTRPTNTPRVSVIVPTYNRADLLPRAVASVRAAGLDDYEIIVVDDGSTDDTRGAVARLGPGVTFLSQENRGPSAARNAGLAVARGRYVAFLDSDDEWLPGGVPAMAAVLDRYPGVGVVFADARMGNPRDGYVSWIEAAGRAEFRAIPRTQPEPKLSLLDGPGLYRMMLDRNPVFTGAVVFRRELVGGGGELFDPAIRAGEDWEVWLRLVRRTGFAYWDEPAAVYTKHPGSLTTDAEGMSRGWCAALRAHARKVADLTPVEWRKLREVTAGHQFSYAYLAYDRGDYRTARGRFADALWAGGFSLKAAAFWAVCALPGPLPRIARRAKHALTGAA